MRELSRSAYFKVGSRYTEGFEGLAGASLPRAYPSYIL